MTGKAPIRRNGGESERSRNGRESPRPDGMTIRSSAEMTVCHKVEVDGVEKMVLFLSDYFIYLLIVLACQGQALLLY